MNDPSSAQLKKAILNDYPRLKESDTFYFSCGPDRKCFNECCADVNIVLTPYDVLRMKNHLEITSSEFLDCHTVIPFSPKQSFPVVFLKMSDDEKKRCQFVEEGGCTIYPNRPWACRMYPIGVASPAADDEDRFFFILKEEPCEGHEEGSEWTIRSWIEDQEADSHSELGEEFKEITLHQFFQSGNQLHPRQMEMLFTAIYDLDKFRKFVFESSFLDKFQIPRNELERIGNDDVELLRLGFRWVKFFLFGEKILEIKDSVQKAQLKKIKESRRSK